MTDAEVLWYWDTQIHLQAAHARSRACTARLGAWAD